MGHKNVKKLVTCRWNSGAESRQGKIKSMPELSAVGEKRRTRDDGLAQLAAPDHRRRKFPVGVNGGVDQNVIPAIASPERKVILEDVLDAEVDGSDEEASRFRVG